MNHGKIENLDSIPFLCVYKDFYIKGYELLSSLVYIAYALYTSEDSGVV